MCFCSASPLLITLFKQRVLAPVSNVTLLSRTRALHSNNTAADYLKMEDERLVETSHVKLLLWVEIVQIYSEQLILVVGSIKDL